MIMKPALRKLALAVHVVTSVGSLGAVAGFLALAVVGLRGDDPDLIRIVYVAMELITRFVIVPAIVASLISGIVSSLGTAWGLVRHYWVAVKLLLTAFATAVLLVQLKPIHTAAEAAVAGRDLGILRAQLVVHSGGGLFVLLVATVLSIYKPRGMTGYGFRKQSAERAFLPP